jgi:hypothetical protein
MFQCKCGQFIPASGALLRRLDGRGCYVHMPVVRFYDGSHSIDHCPVCGAELWPQLATLTDYAPAMDAVYVDHAGRDAKPVKIPAVKAQGAAVEVAA